MRLIRYRSLLARSTDGQQCRGLPTTFVSKEAVVLYPIYPGHPSGYLFSPFSPFSLRRINQCLILYCDPRRSDYLDQV